MWKSKLQENYDNFYEFERYDDVYNLAQRLGFKSTKEAWDANPMIQGSTNPADFSICPLKTIDKILTKVNLKFGAPMGRSNVGSYEELDASGYAGRIYDCAVPMDSTGCYELKSGVYWGNGGGQLRVKYVKDLSYVEFYRKS
jgi:hypothetical protein